MSLKEWGTFLESFYSLACANDFIEECRETLERMDDLPNVSAVFSIHPTYDNTAGRNWLYGVYVRVEESEL
jgi:hypothetical protein